MSVTIFAMTHKKFIQPNNPIYVPLQVGKAVHEPLGYLGDDTGDNISAQNCYYSELTGLYWVWKNFHASDYVGVCHYRRYLINEKGGLLTEPEIEKILSEYDLITTKTLTMRSTYYDGFAVNHNQQDLIASEQVIYELYPDYYETFEKMLHERRTWFGNMFITDKKRYDDYCAWLFPIFEKVSGKIHVEEYDEYHKRVFGFISEFLLYVWAEVNHLKAYQCKVGMIGEKAETRELKNHLAIFFKEKDIQGAKKYISAALEKRPDVLMEASDIMGELKMAMQVITTCENEYRCYGTSIIEDETDFDALLNRCRNLNEIVDSFRMGTQTEGDINYLEQQKVSDIALEISVMLMCTADNSTRETLEKIRKRMNR